MKRLAQFILWFLIPLLAIIFVLLCITGPLSSLVYRPHLPEQKHRLMVGNSHPECALMEGEEWPWINLGKSGECYYYSFPKVKWLIENNPQIEEVWIDLSPNQFMPHMHEWIHDEEHVQRAFLSYAHLLDFSWNVDALSSFPQLTLSTKMEQMQRFLGAMIKPNWELNREDLKWGGFKKLMGNKESFENPDHQGGALQPDPENWKAIKEFCDWARDHQIEVHAIVCPHFTKETNDDTENKVFQFCQSNELAISHYHKIKFPSSNQPLFYDDSHLNQNGALIYSTIIKSLCDSLSHQKALH
ncbi:MAG: hypothetical protein RL062_1307 [Bacteroidota bacterium]|jgi:hypothetical protein